MLRQFFTTDPATINAAIAAYQRQAGPKVVARLAPGADPVEICGARRRGGRLQVQVGPSGPWRNPFACYKERAAAPRLRRLTNAASFLARPVRRPAWQPPFFF